MKTAFISGHKEITDEEFKTHYIPQIHKAIAEGLGEKNEIWKPTQ